MFDLPGRRKGIKELDFGRALVSPLAVVAFCSDEINGGF